MTSRAPSSVFSFGLVNFLRAAPSLAAAMLLTGCIGAVPRPVSATKVEYGCRVKAADVEFIQSGATTRPEVVARLGTNFTALPQQRTIAYSWEMKGGGGVWWGFYVAPWGGSGGESGTWEGGWRAFFIAFDELGVVQKTAFKCLSTRRSLHEQLDEWREKQRPARVSHPGR